MESFKFLSTKDDIDLNFNYFPYKPYPSQIEFIKTLTNTLLNKKAGIFESPTGTGKSLSLMCGVLNFFEIINKKNNTKENSEVDDWLSNFGQSENPSLNKKSNNDLDFNFSKRKKTSQNISTNNRFKYENSSNTKNEYSDLNNEEKMLIKNEFIFFDKKETKENLYISCADTKKKIQVFYCTRTHSQISQIISEMKKIEREYRNKTGEKIHFSCTSLGSRKLLCINKKINNPLTNSSISKINEKCLELIQNKSEKCQFYNQDSIESLSKEISRKIYDIEELHKLGEDISTCPYFSSRKAIDESDMIVIPYNCILNNKIRKSLEIDLENKILIFDEAHNLVENILQTFNSEISLDELILVLLGLNLYYNKYSNRLKSSSNMYLRQLIKITESFIKFLLDINLKKNFTKENSVINLTEFLIDVELSSLNFFFLINFIEFAELHNKIKWSIENFIKEYFPFTSKDKESAKDDTKNIIEIIEKIFPMKLFFKTNLDSNLEINHPFSEQRETFIKNFTGKNLNSLINKHPELLLNFTNFLNSLTYLNEDGKIVIEKGENKSLLFNTLHNITQMKYVMINASREFDNLLKLSRCVIFAGGTMRPIDEFEFLLRILKKENITYFEGKHVVDKGNIFIGNFLQDVITNKLGKIVLNYDQINRRTDDYIYFILATVREHFEVISKIKESRGMVVFISNYDLVEKIKKFNEKFQILVNFYKTNKDISEEFLFFEEKNILNTFSNYHNNILNKKISSILFAVVGGRLSEGINFSDNLARIVLIFGLPFPNVTSTDLKLKMAYYDALREKCECSISGAEYYSNICMKAVNQSVGRSIRHIGDYAAIIFVDSRYCNDNISRKLPKWIKESQITNVQSNHDYEEYKKKLKSFFLKFEN